MIIQPYQPKHTSQLIDIFVNAINGIDDHLYDKNQKQAWIGDASSINSTSLDKWQTRFARTQPLVAFDTDDETADNQAIGFIEFIRHQNHLGEQVAGHAYIDCLFVMPEYQQQGIAQALYDVAMANRLASHTHNVASQATDQIPSGAVNQSIWVYASKVAKPFFIKNGFTVVEVEQVTRSLNDQHVTLEHYLMKKLIKS